MEYVFKQSAAEHLQVEASMHFVFLDFTYLYDWWLEACFRLSPRMDMVDPMEYKMQNLRGWTFPQIWRFQRLMWTRWNWM